MPLTDQDARALTFIARRLRTETHGCREWDDAGTYAKIAELIGQNLALSIERVLCHATDPEAKTPGAIGRPFLPPKPSDQPKGAARPLKRAEQCPRCGGRKGACACRLEHLAATYDDDETEGERMDRETAMQAARDELAAARGRQMAQAMAEQVLGLDVVRRSAKPGCRYRAHDWPNGPEPCECEDRLARVVTHTQTSTDHGPDYCAECSEAISEWVAWPCDRAALRSAGSEETTDA